jgi:hypothetical protein
MFEILLEAIEADYYDYDARMPADADTCTGG